VVGVGVCVFVCVGRGVLKKGSWQANKGDTVGCSWRGSMGMWRGGGQTRANKPDKLGDMLDNKVGVYASRTFVQLTKSMSARGLRNA
jgi:hypothetical protein